MSSVVAKDAEDVRQDEVAVVEDGEDVADGDVVIDSAPRPRTRPRTMTTAEEIDDTISRPGAVRINVKGAFIVDPEAPTPAGGGGASNGRSSPTHHETSDIRLPNHTAVVSHVAIDIGGSLAKLVYFSREAHSTELGGRLNFINFETDRIDNCIDFIRGLRDKQEAALGGGSSSSDNTDSAAAAAAAAGGKRRSDLIVMATGGGAYKYYDRLRRELGVEVLREDEMECLIIGLDFFINEIPREVFSYSEEEPMMRFVEPPGPDANSSQTVYPYLLVNIGSGVSFLKVTGPRAYRRVGGTSLGGGTLWGLLSLLTGARSFDDMLDLADRGDNAKVDMLVGDIYGTDYGKIGLKSTTIASSFGKVFRMKREAESEAEDSGGLNNGDDDAAAAVGNGPTTPDQAGRNPSADISGMVARPDQVHAYDYGFGHAGAGAGGNKAAARFDTADISRSLLYAISNNIGQIAFLQSQIHNLSHIYFGGSFIRGHRQTINTLSYAIKFWSGGAKQAYFLRHEGYLGAVGAFLRRQPPNWGRRGSFEDLDGLARRMMERDAKGDGHGETTGVP